MKLRCTALGSYGMTAKPSQRGNDDSEVLKFKDFQGPLTTNSKTCKALFHFQGLSRSWKNGKKISRTFKNFQGRVATLYNNGRTELIKNLKVSQQRLLRRSKTAVSRQWSNGSRKQLRRDRNRA